MNDQICVTFKDGKRQEYKKGITLQSITEEMQHLYSLPIVAARVNNEIWGLPSKLDFDCKVELLDLASEAGNKVYQRSLTFLMVTAVQELFPEGEVTVEHSLGKGLYCELHLKRGLMEADIEKLEAKMKEIVCQDWPIVKKAFSVQQAIELFSASGRDEKVKLLQQQLNREKVNIYYCGESYDYLYGTMVPSTRYINKFKLVSYQSGFVLLFPEKENPNVIPEFVDHPKLSQIFLEAERWGAILRCGYVATLNEYVQRQEIGDIVRVAEALHEKKIAHIADFVAEHCDKVRVILVAGPSSSGKTTFAQRLSIQLRVNGVRPIPISLDDYFVDRAHTPRDENGEYDFEAIEAIDLELFNEHLTRILSGEAVSIPTYNFKTGEREYLGKVIQIKPDQPLIIEGIHGLNERLTKSVDRSNKIKIYISALTQLSIDNHNRIPTTDTRLIRRIVRDSQFRGHDALRTLQLWQAVRRGEERNIFPFQEEADIMFNSALIYELGVLKKYAEPLLSKITNDHPEYSESKRLLNFLGHFTSINEEVPANSILREFVGDSCFCK